MPKAPASVLASRTGTDAHLESMISNAHWTFGGGTVSMLRYGHRFSKDIDLFVPNPQCLGHVNPRLGGPAEDLTSEYEVNVSHRLPDGWPIKVHRRGQPQRNHMRRPRQASGITGPHRPLRHCGSPCPSTPSGCADDQVPARGDQTHHCEVLLASNPGLLDMPTLTANELVFSSVCSRGGLGHHVASQSGADEHYRRLTAMRPSFKDRVRRGWSAKRTLGTRTLCLGLCAR